MKRAEMSLDFLREKLAEVATCCLDKREDIGYDNPANTPEPSEIIVSDCYCSGWPEGDPDEGRYRGFRWGYTRDSYEDDGSFAIFRSTDGKLWAFDESADTTGHGCQCAASLQEFPDLHTAMMLGLGRDTRERAAELLAQKGVAWTRTPL